MSNKNLVATFCFAILMCFFSSAYAQNNTNSPYTRFGYGELADYSSGRSKSMGGTSLGLRSNNSINAANPASYTGVDSLTFLFEFGAMGKQTWMKNSTSSAKEFNANLEYFTMEFPIGRYFAASAGITPYSYVGYDFSNDDEIIIPGGDTVSITRNFSGTGGLNQLYGGLAGRIGKHLSIGANIYYIFGTLQYERQLVFNETSGAYYATLQDNILTVKDFNFRYGIQYYTTIAKKHDITVGAVLEIQNKLGGDYEVQTSTIDTVTSKKLGSNFETPLTYGFGASYTYNHQFTVASDVTFQKWADIKYFGVKDTLRNRTKATLGMEYRYNPYDRNYFKRITYRLGAYYSDGYLKVDDYTPHNFGITFGLGFPTRGNRSIINLGFEYGRMGKTADKQIREDYFKFSINATFDEMWFFKRRFE